jgi:hypothetical protein
MPLHIVKCIIQRIDPTEQQKILKQEMQNRR